MVARIERGISGQMRQVDDFIAKLPSDKAAYYHGQRATLMELRDFIKQAREEYLEG